MFKNLFRGDNGFWYKRAINCERALQEIAAMETAGANATVKRMAARARKELGE